MQVGSVLELIPAVEAQALFVGALWMAAFLAFFFGLARLIGSRQRDMAQRLEHYAARVLPAGRGPLARGGRSPGPLTQALDRELSRRRRSLDLAQELARADLRLTPAEFLILTIFSVVSAFALGLVIFKVAYVAVAFSLLGYFVPRWYLRYRQARRQTAFSSQLPNALSLLANSIRSGYSLLQSMELLSKELQPPVSDEFARVVREIGLGLSLAPSLNNMLRRIKNDDLDLIVTAILVHHEVGGNLSQILDIIGHTIRERIRIKGEIRVLTAQQQLSGYFVGSLPFFLTVVLFLLNPGYMSNLFTNICGQSIFCTSMSLILLAFLLIRRIVAIEV